MATLYKNKHQWGVYGRDFMFTNHRGSRQYNETLAGKFCRNRKRQPHLYWKDVGKWYMREHHIFD